MGIQSELEWLAQLNKLLELGWTARTGVKPKKLSKLSHARFEMRWGIKSNEAIMWSTLPASRVFQNLDVALDKVMERENPFQISVNELMKLDDLMSSWHSLGRIPAPVTYAKFQARWAWTEEQWTEAGILLRSSTVLEQE